MVFWPEHISASNPTWGQVCALLRVLPLDPRMGYHGEQMLYLNDADSLLRKPMVWNESYRTLQPAPYFQFAVRFSVSCSFHGSIPENDTAQIFEFREALNEAIQSPLMQAEMHRWVRDERRLAAERNADRLARFEKWGGQAPMMIPVPDLPQPGESEPEDPHVFYKSAVENLRAQGLPYNEKLVFDQLIVMGAEMDEPFRAQIEAETARPESARPKN